MSHQQFWRVEDFVALGARRQFSLHIRQDVFLANAALRTAFNLFEELVHDLAQLLSIYGHHARLTGVRSPQVVLSGSLAKVTFTTGSALDLERRCVQLLSYTRVVAFF